MCRRAGQNGGCEMLRGGACRLILANRYWSRPEDWRGARWSAPIFPDRDSWAGKGRLAWRADARARLPASLFESERSEDPLATAGEAISRAFWNRAWAKAG